VAENWVIAYEYPGHVLVGPFVSEQVALDWVHEDQIQGQTTVFEVVRLVNPEEVSARG
jgi:hypothetical protein